MDVLKKLDRKTAEVTFDPHLFTRGLERNFDIDFVEEVVRTGDIVEEKCEPPGKFCFQKYHGKQRQTYTIIVLYHQDFIEVKTAWLTQGR